MFRRLIATVLLGSLGGCAKAPLPDLVVRAATTKELAAFRADLGVRFTAEQIAPFDTALQELQLDAMNRNVTPAAAREADMRAVVNGKTVHANLILGWTARRQRIVEEIATFTAMRQRDLKQQKESAATGPSQTILNRLQNEQDILARLARDLADTNTHLTIWDAPAK